MSKYQSPKGTRDILPPETYAWARLEQEFTEAAQSFGFAEIRVPVFEHTELFERGVGASSDVVRKEMYTFEDKGGRSITLRPEGTAGVVRAYIENGMGSLPAPQKLFYMANFFRYEKMQKGRYREFHQFGCETIGSPSPLADAELLSLLAMFFAGLNIRLGDEKGGVTLKINSIGCPECRKEYHKKLLAYLEPIKDQLCDDCHERMENNPMRVFDCKNEKCAAALKDAPLLIDHLCDDCAAHFKELQAALDELEMQYEIDPYIVRGLDYYTKTVFEFVSNNVGTQGTICGGGRYDGLVEEFGGPPTPAVGFAMGVERLMLELEAAGSDIIDEEYESHYDIYLAALPECANKALPLAAGLRYDGLRVLTDVMGRSLKAQMKHADKADVPYIAIVGPEELENSCVKLRSMKDGKEEVVNFEDISEHILYERLSDVYADFKEISEQE